MNEPTPDEYCPHVKSGSPMTGGWYFAASVPPKAVGMCHECIEWCKTNFETVTTWSEHVEQERKADDVFLSAEYLP